MADKPLNPSSDSSIDSVLHEQRKFECPEEFRQRAHIQSLEEYERLYRESVDSPETFWGRAASDLLWFKNWD
jgi:acetyl-CoA synthetase